MAERERALVSNQNIIDVGDSPVVRQPRKRQNWLRRNAIHLGFVTSFAIAAGSGVVFTADYMYTEGGLESEANSLYPKHYSTDEYEYNADRLLYYEGYKGVQLFKPSDNDEDLYGKLILPPKVPIEPDAQYSFNVVSDIQTADTGRRAYISVNRPSRITHEKELLAASVVSTIGFVVAEFTQDPSSHS